MRVIVIGAGLGGLALAHNLTALGIDVEVHERDSAVESRFQGYRVGLLNRGIDDLHHAVPPRLHALLEAISGDVTGPGRAVTDQLVELAVVPPREEGLLFDRHVLRHLLLADLGDQVRFGRHLESYEESDTAVHAHFADGTTVSGDLLVGADGMGSTVRRQLLPDIQIEDLGVHGAIGRTPLTERFGELVPGWSTMVVSGDLRLFLGKMPFRRPPHEAAAELAPDVHLPATPSYLRWVMLLPDGATESLPIGASPSEALRSVLDLMRDWHPELRALIEDADQENSGVGPLRVGPRVDPWPSGRVTLLGDAAHPMPPGGLGANLAFRDARLLADTLAGSGDVAGYERLMCEYGAAAREEALAGMPLPQRS